MFALVASALLPVSVANAIPIYAVNINNQLIRFDSATPGTIVSTVPITGTVGGEQIVAIDFRPRNERLYATSYNNLYVIDHVTGAATLVGPLATPLNGITFGFDFNPTVDRIRVTSDADQNFRLNPNDASPTPDSNLAYAAADPNAAANARIAASAYTNSLADATATTLYGIDTGLDVLVTQNPPNAGTLNTVGPLGVNADDLVGFDIDTVGNANTGYAVMFVGGASRLYTINLTTGAATLVGAVSGPTVRGIAVAPAGFFCLSAGDIVSCSGTVAANTFVLDAAGGLLRHNRHSRGSRGFNSDFDFDSSAPGDQTRSASDANLSLTISGNDGDDAITIGTAATAWSSLETKIFVNGGGGADSLLIADNSNPSGLTYNITGTAVTTFFGNQVNYNDTIESLNILTSGGADTVNVNGTSVLTTLRTGSDNDKVVFANGATLSGGYIDAGTGNNTLDYSAYTTPAIVDLQATRQLFYAFLSGMQEPGPLSTSQASGVGILTLNESQSALNFSISYKNLAGTTISGGHFHNAPAGLNGPIVRGLTSAERNGNTTPSGTFSGVWTSSEPSLDPPASDSPMRPLSAPSPFTPGSTLVQELIAGRIYFNLHTQPSFPSGEIRGQVLSVGTFNIAAGTSGVTNITNVIGAVPPPAQPLNISTRLRVQTGDNVLIGGFIVTGFDPKRVIIRAIGPSLANSGVSDVLADPVLSLNGPGGEIASNDNWRGPQEADIQASGVAPQNDLESALIATLNPGEYTAIVSGQNDTTGVGLVEVYDLNQTADAQLANISTRGFVETGSNVMIGGFILGNKGGNTRVALLGKGPSLAASGVANTLPDPTVDLRDGNGTRIAFNHNWQDDPSQASQLTNAGLAPTSPTEAGMVISLAPGAYTAIVADEDDAVGVGLVEVYNLK